MKSKLNGLILFIIATFLLVVSRKDLLYGFIDDWRIRRKDAQTTAQSPNELRFEKQRLDYDSIQKSFKNPNLYFEVVRLGNIDFKSYKRNVKIEDGDNAENASESN
ncbi:hypothetical protein ABS764_12640 [Flavobacterium sp. ST-87]|uniref:Septum formation initiator n=1 Tax=Flavobacterium plantiphilum TaxID=3163297 RepID=A0ABW8XUX7_9FLAO